MRSFNDRPAGRLLHAYKTIVRVVAYGTRETFVVAMGVSRVASGEIVVASGSQIAYQWSAASGSVGGKLLRWIRILSTYRYFGAE